MHLSPLKTNILIAACQTAILAIDEQLNRIHSPEQDVLEIEEFDVDLSSELREERTLIERMVAGLSQGEGAIWECPNEGCEWINTMEDPRCESCGHQRTKD